MSTQPEAPALTHFDAQGQAHMVDVGGKAPTRRTAVAEGWIHGSAQVMAAIAAGQVGKGDVLGVARIAAIQASKRCADLIPLCHPLPLSKVAVQFELDAARQGVRCQVEAQTTGPTGVEMEALTAVSVGLLTVYDMCKALDKGLQIHGIRLLSKSGGKSGVWQAPA